MYSVRRETARCRCYGRCLLHELGWRMGAKLVACCVRMNLRGCFFQDVSCACTASEESELLTLRRAAPCHVRVRLADEMVFFCLPVGCQKEQPVVVCRVWCGVVWYLYFSITITLTLSVGGCVGDDLETRHAYQDQR